MGMVVQHNMSAMNANRNLGVISGQLSKSTEKLSSGYRINRAGDDAAGLAISEKMRGQVRGLNRASTNAQDGISLIQTAEGALTETHSILQRMRELAVQAASDTNTDEDRTQIQNEIEQLTNEVDRIASTTEFNTMKLLDGSRAGAVSSKDGSAMVEGTFTNSMVNVEITTDNSADSEYTEIARIEVTKDFTDGMSTVAKDKYSISELKAAYDFITDKTNGNTGYSSTAEWADNVKSAVKILTDNSAADKKDLAGLKDTVKSYDTAIATNQSVLTSALAGIDALKFTESNGNDAAISPTKDVDVYAAGVTKEDVAKAVDNLVNAYVKSGQTASDTSDEIIKATEELKALFNNSSTTVSEVYNDTSFGTYKVDSTVNTASSMTGVGNAPTGRGSADAADGTEIKTGTATTAFKDSIATVTGKITTALGTVAKNMASAHLGKAAAEKNVEKMQNTIELVGNEELMKAYKAYDVAKTELANASKNTGSQQEKEIAQAKLDTATDALNKLNKSGEEVISVTDLFGNTGSVDKFEIGKKVADDGTLTINLKNSAGTEDTVITISNANQLKAGDVITITSKAKVESHAANSGEEALRLQIGANSGQEMNLSINSMRAKDLGIVQTKEGKEGQALDVTSQATASLAVNAFDLAIQKVSTERSKMGAVQNRLEHTISNLDTSAENLQSAESRIRDTDMAEEMTNYSKNNILQQAGQSMLAQANQSTQGVLSLLQ